GDYLNHMPIGVECLICNADLRYPFWMVETNIPSFATFQQRNAALHTAGFFIGSKVYPIERDYRPTGAWANEMAGLAHDHAGLQVILKSIPDGLLDGLPAEDQAAIQAMVGKPVTVVEGAIQLEEGRVEVEFEANGDTHTIWVDVAALELSND